MVKMVKLIKMTMMIKMIKMINMIKMVEMIITMDPNRQGYRKFTIGWEVTKNGCHVRSQGLLKKNIYL